MITPPSLHSSYTKYPRLNRHKNVINVFIFLPNFKFSDTMKLVLPEKIKGMKQA